MRLLIGADGKVTACAIYAPSLAQSLNERICGLAKERASFQPAKDAGGQPMASVWMGSPMFLGPPAAAQAAAASARRGRRSNSRTASPSGSSFRASARSRAFRQGRSTGVAGRDHADDPLPAMLALEPGEHGGHRLVRQALADPVGAQDPAGLGRIVEVLAEPAEAWNTPKLPMSSPRRAGAA